MQALIVPDYLGNTYIMPYPDGGDHCVNYHYDYQWYYSITPLSIQDREVLGAPFRTINPNARACMRVFTSETGRWFVHESREKLLQAIEGGAIISVPHGYDIPSLLDIADETRLGMYVMETNGPAIGASETPPVGKMINLFHLHNGQIRQVPMDLRPLLKTELPITALLIQPARGVDCGILSLPEARMLPPHKQRTPSLDELYDTVGIEDIVVLPAQPVYERVVSLFSNRQLRPKVLSATRLVVGYYDSAGDPLAPLLAVRNVDLPTRFLLPIALTLPPLYRTLDYGETVITAPILFSLASGLVNGVLPYGYRSLFIYSHTGRLQAVSSLDMLMLLLNSVIYKHGQHIVNEILYQVDLHLKKGKSSLRLSSILERERQSVTTHRNAVAYETCGDCRKMVRALHGLIYNGGEFLWSSFLAGYDANRHYSGKSPMSALLDALLDPQLKYIARANDVLMSIPDRQEALP